MQLRNTSRGVTLIEAIFYIALLGLLLVMVVETMYLLLRSQEGSDAASTTYTEGSFVLRKLVWALADMEDAPVLSGSGCNSVMSIAKTNYPNNPIIFERNEGIEAIQMSEGGGVIVPLTSLNAKATCLSFTEIPAAGAAPAGVIATATLDGQQFTVTRYVRH